jgi:basic membrane lipoprotein Med (substrate-binding protein (PBP1-ABC) superfamily)
MAWTRNILLGVLTLSALYATALAVQFKMGAIYSDPINDFGWNYRMELGRAYADRQLFVRGYDVTARIFQSLSPEEARVELDQMAADNFDVCVHECDRRLLYRTP